MYAVDTDRAHAGHLPGHGCPQFRLGIPDALALPGRELPGHRGHSATIPSAVRAATLYRIPEPDGRQGHRRGARRHARRRTRSALRYPDGPHDVEAMYADSAGNLYFVTKGRSRGIALFRLSAERLGAGAGAVPERVDSLPIAPIQASANGSLTPR